MHNWIHRYQYTTLYTMVVLALFLTLLIKGAT